MTEQRLQAAVNAERPAITRVPAADAGPIASPAPERLGICAAHGWWFDLLPGERSGCPEGACRAAVITYTREDSCMPPSPAGWGAA